MIHKEQFFSHSLGVESYFLIVLPEGIKPPLPGVILLRGAPEEWLNGHEDESRRGRNIESVLGELMERGYCAPLAFILPRTMNGSGNAFISHGRALKPELIADQSFVGCGAMDQFFDEELLPRCAATGLLRPDRLSIDGFSLGGASAFAHALRRPDVFRSCGSFDGSFLDFDFDHPGISPDTPSDLRFDDFPYLYGFPPDEQAFRALNPIDLLGARPDVAFPPLMIHYSASRSPTSNAWRVQKLLSFLRERNYAEAALFDEASDHKWWWVDEHLYRSLPFHSHFLYSDRLQSLQE